MLIIPGASALSAFKLEKLKHAVQQVVPTVLDVSVRYVHLATTVAELSASEIKILEQLLNYGESQTESLQTSENTLSLWVAPRPGTISPWSSKATNIAHNCGLQKLLRIERSVL